MKYIKCYLEDQIKLLLIDLLLLVMSAILFIVNNIPAREIIYVIVLNLFVLTVVLCFGFFKWLKKIKKLEQLIGVEETLDITKKLSDEGYISNLEGAYLELTEKILNDSVKAHNKAFEANRDIQEYYGMWVHQIKTPIAALKLLVEEDEAGDKKEKLQEIFRIEQYVDMALQYARVNSESSDFSFEEQELEPIIRGAIRKYARLFIGKKIGIVYEPNGARACTDSKWLGFVIEQLLSNAVKYTKNGQVTIDTKLCEDRVILSVEDTGIGIRAEDLPRICEKGYTGYNGHANEHSSGIGLFLCGQILKKLGHSFDISSTEGVGTKVSIEIRTNLS